VRLTHIPTGIAVACQAGPLAAPEPRRGLEDAARPALRGRAAEGARRRSRRWRTRRPTSAGATRSAATCLQPYQMVKDLRTEVETSDTQGRAGRRPGRLYGRRSRAACGGDSGGVVTPPAITLSASPRSGSGRRCGLRSGRRPRWRVRRG
jgi:hypothetical protein